MYPLAIPTETTCNLLMRSYLFFAPLVQVKRAFTLMMNIMGGRKNVPITQMNVFRSVAAQPLAWMARVDCNEPATAAKPRVNTLACSAGSEDTVAPAGASR